MKRAFARCVRVIAACCCCSKKGATADTDAIGTIHIAFRIARCDLPAWERWLKEQGISIELRKTWKYGGEALYFRDPDGHLLEVVTPGVWNIY